MHSLDEGEWSTSCLGRFTSEKGPRYPLDRGLIRPQNQSGRGGKEKESLLCPYWELNLGCPGHSLVTAVSLL
jgi:hypothetical protein